MTLGTTRYLLGTAFHRLAWRAWGDSTAPCVVCVHGLTRNGTDFAILAEHLAADFYVIAPDLPGRGGSDWLPQAELYALPTYVAALGHLLAAIGRPVHWVGTSLGGLCGMLLAAAENTPLHRLVLNDIGPFMPTAALARIRDYMAGRPDAFADLAEAETYLRRVHAPFGALSDAQWAAMARNSVRTLPDGRLALHYDPAIATPIVSAEPQDVDLWPVWSRIAVPRLVLRGESSDLLLPETLAQMAASGAAAVTVPDCGHAPALQDAPTIAAIADFLRA